MSIPCNIYPNNTSTLIILSELFKFINFINITEIVSDMFVFNISKNILLRYVNFSI
jgi:hypothetical protein